MHVLKEFTRLWHINSSTRLVFSTGNEQEWCVSAELARHIKCLPPVIQVKENEARHLSQSCIRGWARRKAEIRSVTESSDREMFLKSFLVDGGSPTGISIVSQGVLRMCGGRCARTLFSRLTAPFIILT
jgi:hypothetical protein